MLTILQSSVHCGRLILRGGCRLKARVRSSLCTDGTLMSSPPNARPAAPRFDCWSGSSSPSHSGTSSHIHLNPCADESLVRRDSIPAQANDVSSRFGRRLRELRRQKELTQSDMAKKFGIDRSYISDVERGRKSISLSLLEVIALGLQISLSDLFRDI